MKNLKLCCAVLLIGVMGLATACKKKEVNTEPDPEPGNGSDTVVVVPPDVQYPVNETAYAFPGAQGFGRNVTGGRGGKIYKVTNLNDSGAGSLRAAVEAKGVRIVVFDVSGTITLNSELRVRNDNLTLEGQTAPGDGITLRKYPLVVGADNIIIRYMRFRMGDEAQIEEDGLGGFENKDIIVDHCSVSWSIDECVSFYNNDNFTLQWSIISESLRVSAHAKGAHGYGGIWGGKNASFHHNLMAHHDSRTPRFGERAGILYALTDLVDFRNNVIYNWGNNSSYGGEGMNINLINNYYKPGPATKKPDRIFSIDKNKIPGTEVYDIWGKFYISGNYVDGRVNPSSDNWQYGVYNQFDSSYGTVSQTDKDGMKLSSPLPVNDNVTTHTPQIAYERVLAYAGASLKRDAVDIRILDNVRNKTFTANGSSGEANSKNGIIDHASDVGGWPDLVSLPAPLDTDHDGMPDDWEKGKGLNPNADDATGNNLSTAYGNLEVYCNSLVSTITENQIK